MANVEKIISLVSEIAPENLACTWDNVGLQVGDYRQEVDKVLVTLDITEAVLTEGINRNCQMILSHHPLIFKEINSINKQTVTGNVIIKAIKNDLTIYAAHTNLDIADGGLNDYLARLLKLTDIKPLKVTNQESYYKLVVFIPVDHFKEVRDAILDNGAGNIGNYSHSSFALQGEGSFKPLAGSKPYLGQQGQLNQVSEMRFETIVSEHQINEIKKVLLQAHPYEEVAYDFYPLNKKINRVGLGRIGLLKHQVKASSLIQELKTLLNINSLKYSGSLDKTVKKIAICSGSGADFIKNAHVTGVDAYITGDVKYHEAQMAEKLGLILIDTGHYATEIIVKDYLTEKLNKKVQKTGLQVNFLKSDIETNPWHYY